MLIVGFMLNGLGTVGEGGWMKRGVGQGRER